ncbi:helix-turn-helix domain-containing protein [Pseudomonas aeruginosa]|uniref:helix-turn-helix domain-containing protein n=1 Tax=Pseudomonas aeruginosa TaxID=287 RepID=UPI0034D1AAC6
MFDDKDSWPENWSSQMILVKKLLIVSGTGERLREERDRLGMNQTDFGASLGVSRGTQKAYELGSSSPDIRYLYALQSIGVDVQYILTGRRETGDLQDLSEEEIGLLEQYRTLPEVEKAGTRRMVSALAATVPKLDNSRTD